MGREGWGEIKKKKNCEAGGWNDGDKSGGESDGLRKILLWRRMIKNVK